MNINNLVIDIAHGIVLIIIGMLLGTQLSLATILLLAI